MKIEIVKGEMSDGKAAKPRYRVASANGQRFRVRVVDADSPTFGADFLSAFRANVRRARQENTLLDAAE